MILKNILCKTTMKLKFATNNMMKEIALPVLKRKKYAIIALCAAAAMATSTYYLTVASVASKSINIYAQISGLSFTILAFALNLCAALLFGVYAALFAFRRDITKLNKMARHTGDKHALGGVSGATASVLSAGCPTCGAPLFALLGAPTALMTLPFKGLEIKILSILLLLFSIYLLTESIKKKLNCSVNV